MPIFNISVPIQPYKVAAFPYVMDGKITLVLRKRGRLGIPQPEMDAGN
jgi:hypothetical protein